jgi:hypothetical protein
MIRTASFFGPRLDVKRPLRRYAADGSAHRDFNGEEFCAKHAYNGKKLVPGSTNVVCNYFASILYAQDENLLNPLTVMQRRHVLLLVYGSFHMSRLFCDAAQGVSTHTL